VPRTAMLLALLLDVFSSLLQQSLQQNKQTRHPSSNKRLGYHRGTVRQWYIIPECK